MRGSQLRSDRVFIVCLLALAGAIGLVPASLCYQANGKAATSSSSPPPSTPMSKLQMQDLNQVEWWKKTNFYHIYVRSFKDSNGDGNGDLRGIIQKLDYLKEIGVETVLMSPFYSSPMKDCGYDVDNYREINPMFGTMQDFDDLMSELKKRQMRIVLDFIPNHSSNKHHWFWCSERALLDEYKEECGKYKDYYVWSSSKRYQNSYPTNWNSVFGGGPAWTWSEVRKEFYLHQFLPEQPDMNFKNPAVREEFKEIARFWLRKGADGLRVDAIIFLIEDTENWPDNPPNPAWKPGDDPFDKLLHNYTKSLPASAEIVRDWRQVTMEPEFAGHQKVIITEGYDNDLSVLINYYGHSPQDKFADMPFVFELLKLNTKNMNAISIQQLVTNWTQLTRDLHWPDEHGAMAPWNIWVMGNHDNSRLFNRVGEHNHLVFQWLAYFLPGVPVNYYGDELPTRNANYSDIPKKTIDEGEPSRLPFRTPMAWSPEEPAGGFSSTGDIWLPLNRNYKQVNVQTLLANTTGEPVWNTLQLFVELQKLRRKHLNTFVFGDAVFFQADGANKNTEKWQLALGRTHKTFGSLLLLANLDRDNELAVRLRPAISITRQRQLVPPSSGRVLMANFENAELAPKVKRGAYLDKLEGLVLARSQAIILQF